MRQKIFGTQQIAKELEKEAIAIWRQGNHDEYLEGIEKDPVISLLMTALAYQENAADYEMERLKAEVLEDFSRMLIPYELCHAVPASVIVQAETEPQISQVKLTSNQIFHLSEDKYGFIPLLNTTVYQVTMKSVVRMDARRWKVSLNFKEPINSLAGLSFLVDNSNFKDLNVTIGGRKLSLVKPWDYADLPLADCFSLDTMLYNRSLAYDASATWFDLFALHNKRLFVVSDYQPEKVIMSGTSQLDLVFEFIGINDDFSFDKSQLLFNSVALVNVVSHSATLSHSNPIVRIAGNEEEGTLLHLLRPSSSQMFRDAQFTVRRAANERFNINGLLKLLHCLLDKYSSDYYAFMQVGKNGMDPARLYQWMKTLTQYLEEVPQAFNSGVYLLMSRSKESREQAQSLTVSYLTTSGGKVNGALTKKSSFNVPVGLSMTGTRIVSEPIGGCDETLGNDVLSSMSRYYMVTGNRLVTPADVKIFCYNELLRRYQLDSSMVKRMEVKNQLHAERGHSGFETIVDIVLVNDVFVKRSFSDKIVQAELILQKMIEVRSATLYPVQVSIRLV